MNVDTHVHPIPKIITVNDIISGMNSSKIDIAFLLALDVDPEILTQRRVRNQILARLMSLFVVDGSKAIERMASLLHVVKTSNVWVATLVKNYPDRFIGFGSVNISRNGRYVEKKLREIDRLNLAGVKLIPTFQFFNPEKSIKKMRQVFRFCEDTDRVVICHSGCDPQIWENPDFSEDANPKYLEKIVREFMDVYVILAHMGCYSARYSGIWLNEALELGKKYENVWFDTAAVTYLLTERNYVERIRYAVGFNRVLFGSDYPVVQGANMRFTITEVRESPYLTEEEKKKVLGLNASRLLNI